MTLVLTGVFSYLAITGKIVVDNFTDMFQIIMIFYFGTQSGKAEISTSNPSKNAYVFVQTLQKWTNGSEQVLLISTFLSHSNLLPLLNGFIKPF